MQTLSPWATTADIDALHASLAAMHRDLRAIQTLSSEQQADVVVAPVPPAALSV